MCCVCVLFSYIGGGAPRRVSKNVRRRRVQLLSPPLSLAITWMLFKPCKTQESGDSGTRFEERACPKPGANKSANVGGMRGSVGVSMHEGRHLFYLGVCISIHLISADAESFRRFLPSKILLK